MLTKIEHVKVGGTLKLPGAWVRVVRIDRLGRVCFEITELDPQRVGEVVVSEGAEQLRLAE